ncbi:hypothetical protein CYMTET_31595, partial [Cymbomonas tetramitiformis]
ADGNVAITERAKPQAVIEIVPSNLEEVQVDNAEENVEGSIMVPSENPNTVFTEQELDEAEDVIASDMLAEEEEAENSDAESSDDEGEEEIFTVDEKLGVIKNDEDIADLEYEDPWHEADGLDVEVYDQHV